MNHKVEDQVQEYKPYKSITEFEFGVLLNLFIVSLSKHC